MSQTWSPTQIVLVGIAGLVVGLCLEALHRSGWYLRPGEDVPVRPVPCLCVTAATALAWVLLAGTSPPLRAPFDVAVLLAHLAVACVVVLLAAADAVVHRLPDALTLPSGMLTLLAAAWALGIDPGVGHPDVALLAGVAVPTLLLGVAVMVGGIGLGDVKLSTTLAALLGWHGWDAVLTGFTAAVVLAGTAALTLVLRGRAHRGTPLPLGPFLGVGTLLAVIG